MARRTSEQWAQLVEQWKTSGLTGPQFGAQQHVDPGQLAWWKWHLKTRAPSSPGTALVPVRVVARRTPQRIDEPGISPIEIALPSGARLRVVRGVDEDTLTRVVRSLERACC
jgi:hypothetical protein